MLTHSQLTKVNKKEEISQQIEQLNKEIEANNKAASLQKKLKKSQVQFVIHCTMTLL
jgi:hypothetical protein